MRSAAAYSLVSHGLKMPLSSSIETGVLPRAAMRYAFIALLVASAGLFIAGLFRFRRWVLVAWILFTIWILLCFGISLLGTIGHTSSPPWQKWLQSSWPLYISFAFYLAWFIGAVIYARVRGRAGALASD